MKLLVLLLPALVLCSLLAAGCATPCEDLAHKVCDCQPTRAKQDRCDTAIDAAVQNMDLSSEEDDRCQAILDSGSCTCEAIAAADYAACGLSADAAATLVE
jgi:hypothetical protein